MTTNNLAIAGNFFLFIEALERFRELFLACHGRLGIFLIRAGI